jgi:hypothetical protein
MNGLRNSDGLARQESEAMGSNLRTGARVFALAALLSLAGFQEAKALFPDYPPFYNPPPTHHLPPPVITPPPIHTPPPVAHTPEPASVVLGAIGAGIGGLVARRRKLARTA